MKRVRLYVLFANLILISCYSRPDAPMNGGADGLSNNSKPTPSPSASAERASAGPEPSLAGTAACNRIAWQTVGPEGTSGKVTKVWKESGQMPFFFSAKMAIDADGSPHAYNPSNTGLDDNRNAKDGARWVGIAVKLP